MLTPLDVLERDATALHFVHCVLMALHAAENDPYDVKVVWRHGRSGKRNGKEPDTPRYHKTAGQPDGDWRVHWRCFRRSVARSTVTPVLAAYGVVACWHPEERVATFERTGDAVLPATPVPDTLAVHTENTMAASIAFAANAILPLGRCLLWHPQPKESRITVQFVDSARSDARVWWANERCAVLAWAWLEQLLTAEQARGTAETELGGLVRQLLKKHLNPALRRHGLVADLPCLGFYFAVRRLV